MALASPSGCNSMMQVDLSGSVVIVTGGAGGIGTGIVESFETAGASVAVHYNTTKPTAIGPKSIAVQLDLTDENSHQTLIEFAMEKFGKGVTLMVHGFHCVTATGANNNSSTCVFGFIWKIDRKCRFRYKTDHFAVECLLGLRTFIVSRCPIGPKLRNILSKAQLH